MRSNWVLLKREPFLIPPFSRLKFSLKHNMFTFTKSILPFCCSWFIRSNKTGCLAMSFAQHTDQLKPSAPSAVQ